MFNKITDKNKVKELETETTPVVNVLRHWKDLTQREKVMDTLLDLINWLHNHQEVDANTSIYKKWDKISELLDITPSSKPIHSFKNALWCLEWTEGENEHGNYVLIYYDKRGMKIQINPKFRKDQVVPMLEYLKSKIVK